MGNVDIREGFKDILLVDDTGAIAYFKIAGLDFFDLKPEHLLGKKIPQLYDNLSDETSTLMRAVHYGEEKLDCEQVLITKGGKRVRQISDTLCVRDGERVIGAVEFAYYDESRDVLAKKDTGQTITLYDMSNITMEDIIGQSSSMTRLKKKAAKIVDLQSPILITGQTGVGKEMLARAIHNASKRKNKPFIYVNCSALPETLLESILFGTKRGSFTDAMEKEGLFLMADKGTLFLDEINTMPFGLQGKLLKAIEDKCIRPIGAEEEIYLDVRIIASCNLDAIRLLNSDLIRKDLYFRLSVIQFEIPPLKERGDDVLLIADYYIRRFNDIFHWELTGISDELKSLLRLHTWPGNVRELRNLLESACYGIAGGLLTPDDVGDRLGLAVETESQKFDTSQSDTHGEIRRFKESGMDLKEFLRCLEMQLISTALEETNHSLKDAASRLGISPQLLRQKAERFGLY